MEILRHEWRWAHNYFIRSDDGIVKIRQRPDQLVLANILYPAFFAREPKKVVILKNRQRGTSTWCSLFCLDCTAYYPGKVADTLADTQQRASSIFDNVAKLAWDRIPKGLKPRADKDNVAALDFTEDIGSKYIISATKSEPADILHISEAPYFPDEGKIKEAEQMVRKRGITIMESTAFGVGNYFERTFTAAWQAKKKGQYHHWEALFFPWFTDPTNTVTVHPEMQLKNKAFIEELTRKYGLTAGQQHFYDQKMFDLDEEVFQFYPSEPEEAFLSSGRPVFNLQMLKMLEENQARKPLRVTDDGIEIYEEPDASKHYGIGVDTAEGLADGDNSVAKVICKETGVEVASVSGKISAIDEDGLARLVRLLAQLYANHICVVERNNHGHTVIAFLRQDGSVNLYRQEDVDSMTGKMTQTYGWNTDQKSKAFAIDTLKKDLKAGACVPRAFSTYGELRVFVHGERGKMGGLKGHHDDEVIALALANIAAQQSTMGEILFV
jgi:hypothetical protein